MQSIVHKTRLQEKYYPFNRNKAEGHVPMIVITKETEAGKTFTSQTLDFNLVKNLILRRKSNTLFLMFPF